MDLLHCQRCGVLPQYNPDARQRYYMTSCAHLFCENCARTVNDQCPQCQRNCTVMELNAQTDPNVKSLFRDPMEMLKDAITKPLRIFNFQKQLNKDKIRIMGNMMETLKKYQTENANLKGENNRLRQVNEEILLERNQLQLKVNEQQRVRVSPQAQMSLCNNQGPGSDPLNLFRDTVERPNAQVQPISRNHQQHNTTSFSTARTPVGNIMDCSQSQVLGQQGFSGGRFTPRSTSSNSPIFATPASSLSHGLFVDSGRSPFFNQSVNASAVMFGSGSSGQNMNIPSSSSTPNKTPDLINRLRNLKCKSTPNTDLPSRF